MPLDPTAAAATAVQLGDLFDSTIAAAYGPLAAEPLAAATFAAMKAALVANETQRLTIIFAAIVANAVVSPIGVPPMSNSGGPVGGTGKIL